MDEKRHGGRAEGMPAKRILSGQLSERQNYQNQEP
jgi:hypothetical protein